MAGIQPDVSKRSNTVFLNDWAAPLIAFISLAATVLSLLAAMLEPAD